MRQDPFIITLIKWVCWSFVAGVGVANVLGPQETAFMMRMWTLCAVFFGLSFYLYFANRQLVKYTLIPAFMVLGIASYQYKFDTSNEDHVINFISARRWDSATVRGVIDRDPDVRDWITHVVIRPVEIDEGHGFKELSGRTGNIIVFVSQNIRDENPYYDTMDYGDLVEVTAPITEPMRLSNPYGFDYADYLINQNIYASMYVGDPENISYKGKSALGLWGGFQQMAFRIKDRMILGLKKTMPPPYSAFIGGVTVGARGGVPEVMKHDFQATGVAHVLALSGLHVGFLALMLIIFFNTFLKSKLLFYQLPTAIFRREVDLTPHSQKFVPLFIILVMAIFVIITGARPATIRASMMFSIMIVFSMWFGLNTGKAGSLTIPMSAAIMLAFNSFLIFDASFALSFTAVWSIIYLNQPIRKIFSRIIVGWGQAVFFFFFTMAITILIVAPHLMYNMRFLGFFTGLIAFLSAGAFMLEKKWPLRGFEFEGWWPGISGFFCAQLAIQIGMMWPLSGLYFNRFPVAGILANFIAIPLIGIIVPLGLLGQLSTFIPVIGEPIGLAIGATNSMLSGFFLWMARFFRTYFPYPIQSAPSNRWLIIYYSLVLIFAFNAGIRRIMTKKLKMSPKAAAWAVGGLMVLVLSSGFWARDLTMGATKEPDEMLVTFFDVGFGNSTLIQTPRGKSILVDGGNRGAQSYWTAGRFAAGETVIIPNLSGYNIPVLDIMVSSNPLPENLGGLVYVAQHFPLREAWTTLDPERVRRGISYSEFLRELGDVRLEVERDRPLPMGIYLNYYDYLDTNLAPVSDIEALTPMQRTFGENLVPHKFIRSGQIIYEEEAPGGTIRLEVLSPPEDKYSGTENDVYNNSAVLKLSYGLRSILLPSSIQADIEWELTDLYLPETLRSDVLLAPDHGSSSASTGRFLDAVRPTYAVVQYGFFRGRSFYDTELNRTLRNYRERDISYFRTDEVGAVELRTDGRGLTLRSVLGENH